MERERQEHRKKRDAANKIKNEELLLARQRKAEAEARDYSRMHAQSDAHDWEQDEWDASRPEGDVSPYRPLPFLCAGWS